MSGLGWVYGIMALLSAVAVIAALCLMIWPAVKQMAGALAQNAVAALFQILVTPQYALSGSIIFSILNYYNPGQYLLLALISLVWLAIIIAFNALVFTTFSLETIWPDIWKGVKTDDEHQFLQALASVWKAARGMAGFWATLMAFIGYPLLLHAINALSGAGAVPGLSGYENLFALSAQKLLEALPGGFVKYSGLHLSTFDTDTASIPVRLVTQAYQLLNGIILSAAIVVPVVAQVTRPWTGKKESEIEQVVAFGQQGLGRIIIIVLAIVIALWAVLSFVLPNFNRPAVPFAEASTADVHPSFDCGRAKTDSDIFICSDQEIADADVRMANAYRAARLATPNAPALRQDQKAFKAMLAAASQDKTVYIQMMDARTTELQSQTQAWQDASGRVATSAESASAAAPPAGAEEATTPHPVEFAPTPGAPPSDGPRSKPQLQMNGDSLDNYYPPNAMNSEITGTATVECTVMNGRLTNCRIVAENPQGYDFGAATVRIWQDHGVVSADDYHNGDTVQASVRWAL